MAPGARGSATLRLACANGRLSVVHALLDLPLGRGGEPAAISTCNMGIVIEGYRVYNDALSVACLGDHDDVSDVLLCCRLSVESTLQHMPVALFERRAHAGTCVWFSCCLRCPCAQC